MRRAEEGEVQIGEVNDSEEDGRREPEEPQAEQLFANIGGAVPEQGTENVVYHMVDAADLTADGRINENLMYQFQTPNLQTLEPIPPEQLRNAGFMTNQPLTVSVKENRTEKETREEQSEEEEKGEKEKKSAKREKEKKRWEEKSKRMEKQLQEQRLQSSFQRAQAEARLAAYKRAKDLRMQQALDPGIEEEQPSGYSKQKRHSSQTTWAPTDAAPQAPGTFKQQQWPPQTAATWSDGPPNAPGNWQYGGQWQQPSAKGTWIWKDQQEGKRAAVKKRASRYETSDESEDTEDELDSREKRRKRKERERNWEKETQKQRETRHKKYEKMAETADSDKQSIKHQVAAMFKSVIAQEKVIKHLKSLVYAGSSTEQIQENRDLVEELKAARKELVERITYLEVAYDYDWEAAKVFREMKEANPSSIVLKAVTEAKKRKAASKGGKETDEGKKARRKTDGNNNSHNNGPSNSGGWRNTYQQPQYNMAPNHYWGQSSGFPPTANFYQPQNAYPPPAAPYNRQAGTYRPPRPPGCFSFGEANHGFRRCPNAPSAPPAAMAKPPPPPPNT